DPDGVVRRVPIAFRLGAGLVPGMAAEVERLIADRPDITVVSDEHDPLSFFSGIGIASLETPKGLAPTGKGGQAWLRYAAEPELRLLDPDALAIPKGAVVVV